MDIAIWLIEQGVDVYAVNKNGGTAAWELHHSLTNKLYSDWAYESALVIKKMLEERGVEFPPPTPEENRKKHNLIEPCFI